MSKNQTFNTVLELVDGLPSEEDCRELLKKMRWGDKPSCPHCKHDQVYVFSDGKRYSCKNCEKQFTTTVGTIFENSNIPLRKWLIAIHLAVSDKKGISSIQLAKQIGVTQATAWSMMHKIRQLFEERAPEMLEGIIEVDETYIGGRHRGKRGRGSDNKIPVFGAVERDGRLITEVVPDTKRATLEPIIREHVREGEIVMSDEWWAYRKLRDGYHHFFISHGKRQYADGEVHTNTIEGVWSLLKRGIKGTHHSVSHKHLHRYVREFTFKYNARKQSINDIFLFALSHTERRLKNAELIKA